MDTRALISETLKYLDTDENGKPKYTFSVYRNGINQSINKAASTLTFGMVNNVIEENTDEPAPVSVYTINDIFDTIKSTGNDIMMNIQALPETFENIKVSLNQLGYNSLNMLIDTLENAVLSIEIVQTVNEVYRIAKPLVEKVRDIATIMFYFPSSAKVAQDVLQYLTRFTFQTAKNMLGKLFDILMDTPVFAVYENDDTVNLSGAYASLADEANNLVESIATSKKAFGEIMKYANSSKTVVYEPSYNNLDVGISDDIVDVFNEPNTRKIYIASEHAIYILKEDYSLREIITTSNEVVISKIYCYNDKVYYIAGNSVYNVDSNAALFSKTNPKIIYSNPILLYDDAPGKIYNPTTGAEESINIPQGTIKFSTFDFDKKALYCVIDTNENNTTKHNLIRIIINSGETYSSEAIAEIEEIYGMSYFNNILYIVKKDSNNNYYVAKLSAGMDFEANNYVYVPANNRDLNIIYTNGDLATDGLYIYRQNGKNLINPQKAKSSINCVAEKTYNGKNYFVATGGDKVHVAASYSNGLNWVSKELYFEPINSLAEEDELPDSLSGCLWYSAPGQCFIAHSQKNIYLVGPDHIKEIFDFPKDPEPEKLAYKEFVSFENWWDEEPEVPDPYINVDQKISVDDCIITSMRVINNSIYVALYNPNYSESTSDSVIKTGIYKVVVSKLTGSYQMNILYNNPLYVASASKNPKIYSFNKVGGSWYYTDGKVLHNMSVDSETQLELGSDRALTIINKNSSPRILTARALLDLRPVQSFGEVPTSVKYTSKNKLKIASTENGVLISDGEFVYNIIDSSNYAIKSEMFQICYKKFVTDFDLLQSSNAAFIVSGGSLRTVPFYEQITSYNYGCGYYTDTTPNKWYGAAPYYFASNVLNNRKNKLNRDVFIKSFVENFKVELEKLLKRIPDAFIQYTNDKLRNELQKVGVSIDGDDGQILNLLIESVSSTTANSIGMYVHDKFLEKLGDDSTFQTFAESVYNACLADNTNNMTKDFYDIFEELYYSTITEAFSTMHFGRDGLSGYLLRYYQNHKAEWAKSMTDLIDIDIVDPEIYEMPLKDTQKLKQTTYRFNYKTGNYEYEYIATPSKNFNNVISGYLYNNDFYTEPNGEGSVIDHRTTDSEKTYYELDGEKICYKNPEDNKYYKFEINDYTLTEDTSVDSQKTYYERVAEDYDYSLTEDTEEENKFYYSPEYELTEDTSVISGKKYFSKSGGIGEYVLMTGSSLPLGTYYEKKEYQLTTDTSIEYSQDGEIINSETIYLPYYDEVGVDRYNVTFSEDNEGSYVLIDGIYYYDPENEEYANRYIVNTATPSNSGTYYSQVIYNDDIDVTYYKDYYQASYKESSGSIVPGTQYYKEEYVKTSDTQIDPEKKYYEYVIYQYGSDAEEREYFEYDPGATGVTKYSVDFTELEDANFNDFETYYNLIDGKYIVAEELDIQYGPFYYASELSQDADGDYVKKSFSDPGSSPGSVEYFSEVLQPLIDNLPNYYEVSYVKIKTPVSTSGCFEIEYTKVEDPNEIDLPTYYEKVESYIAAGNLNYNNNQAAIINDRNLYKMVNAPLEYTLVQSPSGNPQEHGWYEISAYNQIVPGSSLNPHDEGLYELTYSPEDFDIVQSPSGNPQEHGWYEYACYYSNLYDDDTVYMDLGAEEISSSFPEEDNDWHNKFYSDAAAAGTYVTDKDSAIAALDSLTFPYPSWKWQALINESVTTLYIPTQGEQYREIIRNSNMDPIQWQELPSNIDQNSFEYALNTLLFMIKQSLLTNITMLVDGGKVKCYSCIDASTVIKKIVDKNYLIWRNQINLAKDKIRKATSLNEIRMAFSMVKAYDKTLYLLEKILNQQSALYAKYIDQIIEEQIINDNDTEVLL